METGFTSKTKDKSYRPQSADSAPERDLSSRSEIGAVVGLPLFLGGLGAAPGDGAIQRKMEADTEEEESEEESLPIQAKLTLSQPGDESEREADRVADMVTTIPLNNEPVSPLPSVSRYPVGAMRPTPTMGRQSLPGIYGKPLRPPGRSGSSLIRSLGAILRHVAHDAQLSSKSAVEPGPARPTLHQQMNGSKGNGSPLPENARSSWEFILGADFSKVRIHTGVAASEMSKGLGAQAFTHGSDIYFNEGRYDPASNSGKQLLAHELTHVVQQDGDHQRQVVARAPENEPDITAAEYRRRFAREIGDGVADTIITLPLETGSRYISLIGPFSPSLGLAILGDTGAVLTEKIDGWLRGRENLDEIINKARPKGRVTVTDDKDTWVEDKTGEGPARWFPGVAVAVANAVHRLLFESLARIVPRYIQAAVAVGIAEEQRAQKSLLQVPAPAPGDIVPSHPVDRNTIGVLTQFAKFDYQAYRAANPDDTGKVGRLRPVCFCWEAPRTGSYWIRVTSPADPTNEEVAQALFGSPTFAGEIKIAAAPLFGIADAAKLLPLHRLTLASLGVDTRYVADPLKDALTGPLHDEIAKNQSTLPSGLLNKTDVLRTIDQSLMILDAISLSGARFGMDKGPYVASVNPLKEKLKTRRANILTGSHEQALTWANQAAAQQNLLTEISFAFDRHVTRLDDLTKMVTKATEKIGGFNLPPYVRMAMLEVAMRYADAAGASEFPATARAILARAEDRAGMLPVEFLEGTLESVQRVIDDARAAKAGQDRWASYDVGGMRAREEQYRLRFARIRALIRTDPNAATKELGEIQKLIVDLQLEAEMVGNMDAIDSAWRALDEAYSFWFSSLPTKIRLNLLKAEGDVFHARWNAIFNAWKTGDAKAKEKAKEDLNALRADPKLPEYFARVKDTVKDAQIEALIGKIVALLVITVVTMGVGDIVAAGALGWGLGAGSTAVLVGGAEALTFTLLSQIFLDNEHSLGHIAYEFSTNWALFGILRRFQAFAEVAKLGTVTKFGGQAILLGSMTFAKAELDVLIKEGRHLTKEEIKTIALQGIAMYIAMYAIAPMTKPLFADLESGAYAFSAKLKANNRTRAALETQAGALKGSKDFAAARDYVSAEKAWLEERLKILDDMEAHLKMEEADPSLARKGGGLGGKIKLNSKDLASLKSELKASLDKVAGAEQPLLYLEPKAPGLFTCPRERIGEVVKSLGETTKVSDNLATGVKTYEIKTPDGTVIKVVETITPSPATKRLAEMRQSLTSTEAQAVFDMLSRSAKNHEQALEKLEALGKSPKDLEASLKEIAAKEQQAAAERSAKITEELQKSLKERGLDGDPMFTSMDAQTDGKVNTALKSDPFANFPDAQKAAQSWAQQGAGGNPREFANRYEYAKAKFTQARDAATLEMKTQGNFTKAGAAEKAAAEVTPEKLSQALQADLKTVQALGKGQNVGETGEASSWDIAKAVQKLERFGFETDTAEAYHAIKHSKEMPSLQEGQGNLVQDHALAAKDTIKTGDVVSAKQMLNGSTQIIIHKAYPGMKRPLEAIIYVEPNGKVTLASYGEAKAKI